MRKMIKAFRSWDDTWNIWRPVVAILVTFLFWAMVAACVAPTTPAPMADAPPEPVVVAYNCGMSGEPGAFMLECTEPTATPEPSPTVAPTMAATTPEPAFYYFWCQGDPRCTSGQFRVYWDRELSLLRCALSTGSKLTLVSTAPASRDPDSEVLGWVITGADAGGGRACEGWTPMAFMRAAE